MSFARILFLFSALMSPSFSALERGDQEFAGRNYPVARAVYDSALTSSRDSAALLWRLARVLVCQADISPEEDRLDLYRRAERYAVRSISADSMRSEGHTWRAAALGNVAVFEGSKAKVQLCTIIKLELDRAIELNPGDDIAYSILGSFYRTLGNVSWLERRLAALFLGELPEGGYVESEHALKRAIALAPDVIRHHFELGLLYIDLEREADALEEFHRVILLPQLLASDAGRQVDATRFVEDIRAR